MNRTLTFEQDNVVIVYEAQHGGWGRDFRSAYVPVEIWVDGKKTSLIHALLALDIKQRHLPDLLGDHFEDQTVMHFERQAEG
jgi:hypothetical protein